MLMAEKFLQLKLTLGEKNLDSGCGSGSKGKTQNPAGATSGELQQRWEGCNILPSGSSREFLKLNPSPTIVQKVQDI